MTIYQQNGGGDIFADHHQSWVAANAIEAEGRRRVDPYLRQVAYQGRVVWLSQGALAAWMQKRVGDVVLNISPDTIVSIELKVEEENKYKNFFLETYSNKSRGTPGWMFTLRTDLLLYFFLDENVMYFMDFKKLKRWFCARQPDGTRYAERFKEKEQRKRRQLNDTHARAVPISAVMREGPGYRTVSLRQLDLFDDGSHAIKGA